MKLFALLVVFGLLAAVLCISAFIVLDLIKKILVRRDQDHVQALYMAAERLQSEGYLEAAAQFRDYAEALESRKGMALL